MNQSSRARAARISMKRAALTYVQSQMGEDPTQSQIDRALTLQVDLKRLEELDRRIAEMDAARKRPLTAAESLENLRRFLADA